MILRIRENCCLLSTGSNPTRQYPVYKSKVVNSVEPANESRVSSMQGRDKHPDE